MEIRLQKYLADSGVASRRGAEGLIAAGRVMVNGATAQIGTKVAPGRDVVLLDGGVVGAKREELVYIALNKPVGVVSSAKDQFGRVTVVDLVKMPGVRLYPVGRLDYATSGLILLTNDGDVTYKLTHPRHSVEKVYRARLARAAKDPTACVAAFAAGVVIDGRKSRGAKLVLEGTRAEIVLKEGRNRQVRKMFESVGNEVLELARVAVGEIWVDGLELGRHRALSEAEVDYLKSL